MYVRRWPRISASSRTPPSDIRTNSRPIARAIDSPIEVLPVPGGPISVRIAPARLSAAMPRSSRSLRDGDVLDDAVLDVLQPGVVAVEDLPGVDGVELLVGALAPRNRGQPVQVGPDHLALATVARALQPPELALGLLADGVGHAGLRDLAAVLVRGRSVVLAELLANGVHLLAQQVLPLLLGGAGLHVVADLAAELQLGEPLALQLDGQRQALGHVQGLEDPDLLLEGQVGRVARRVGQGAGLGDRAHPGGDAAVVAPELEQLLDHGAVLAGQLARAPVDGLVVGVLGDFDEQAAGEGRIGLGDADDAAGSAGEHGAASAAGQADAVGDRGDGADGGVLALVTGHEHDALGVADVDGEGDVHRGEDHGVVEGDQEQLGGHEDQTFVDLNG